MKSELRFVSKPVAVQLASRWACPQKLHRVLRHKIIGMAKLSRFGKFFINRSNERNSKRFFHIIRGYLTLDENSSWLEIGSGKGFLSYEAFEYYHPRRMDVTDYDLSQVEAAKSLFASKLGTVPPSIEFRTAYALNLPFENERFDAVLAMVVLHHVEKRDWAIPKCPEGFR